MNTKEQENFDINFFQQQVMQEVSFLTQPLPQITRRLGKISRKNQEALIRLLEKDLGQEQARKEVEYVVRTGKMAPETLAIINRRLDEIAEANVIANQILKRQDIRKKICAALQSISTDTFEIAKILTPLLLTLAFSGVLLIPLNPLIFATVAVIIAKMGIASLCTESKSSDA